MPLPFMRAMGLGGLLVPLVSIAAAATFLPALLAVHGTEGQPLPLRARGRCSKSARAGRERHLGAARALDHAPAGPLFGRHRRSDARARLPGHAARAHRRRQPRPADGTEAVDGLELLERTLGPGALVAEPDRGRHRRRRNGVWSAESLAAAAAPHRRASARSGGRSPARSRRPRCSSGARACRPGVLARARAGEPRRRQRPGRPDPGRRQVTTSARRPRPTSCTGCATAMCRRPASRRSQVT